MPAVALMVSACSMSGGLGEFDTAETSESRGTVPAELALVEPETLDDDTLRVAVAQLDTWLPSEIAVSDPAAVLVADLVYDGLTEAVGTSGQLRPGLATAWSADGAVRTWTFTIDGERTTPDEVAASFAALLASDTPTLASVSLDHVESVTAEGDTVVFGLSRPDAGLPWLLSGVAMSVVGADGAATGRYQVTEAADGLTLDGAGPVVIEWAADGDDAYDQLLLGRVHAAVVDDASLGESEGRFGVRPVASNVTRFYVLNARSATLQRADVRDAITMAIDRTLVQAQVGIGAFASDGVAGPAMGGFRLQACGTRCVADPTAAAAAVAGLGEPVALTVGYVSESQTAPATAVADQLAAAGFDITVARYGATELVAAVEAGEVDVYAAGWAAPATSLDAVVSALFDDQSATNLVGATPTAAAVLFEQAAVELDDRARWDLLSQAQTTVIEESFVIPIAVGKSHVAHSPTLEGVVVRADGSLDLSGRP